MFQTSITTRGFTDEFGDPDLIYYNADIINQKTYNPQDFQSDPVAKFTEIRNTAIIQNPRNFEFSILRCDINGAGKKLPLTIPNVLIDGSNTDANKLVYTIGIYMAVNFGKSTPVPNTPTVASSYKRTNLTFVPENLFAPKPSYSTPIKEQDLSTDYYYLSTYEKFLTFINTALESCLSLATAEINSFTAGIMSNPVTITGLTAPKFIYDNTTQLFSVYVPTSICSGINPNNYPLTTADLTAQGGTAPYTLSPVVQIWMSQSLWDLFSSFQANNQGDTQVGEAYQLLYYNDFNNTVSVGGCSCSTPPVAGMDYKVLKQEYPTTSTLWSPISSIVFCSTLLPIFNEYVSNPVVFNDLGSSNEAPYTTTNSNFNPIITDISLPLDYAQDYRGFISYVPSAEYRMSAINGNQPINALDIQIFWKGRLSQKLYPLRLSNFTSINLKILFRRRGL